ncbi:MAG: dihydrodipicolinate synthase family protein, partial [Planctomycetota bacterium]
MSVLPEGVLPPVVTPFKKDRFDRAAFADNMQKLNGTALAGYVVLGSNGEGVYLNDDEAIEVVETAAEARDPDKKILVGTGRESTERTVELTKRAAEAGADAALVVPPSYYRASMSESALEFHYRSVADESKIPILLYHVPKFSPIEFSPRLVSNLASHPNIQGIKDTSGNMVFLASILAARTSEFRIYVGSASF